MLILTQTQNQTLNPNNALKYKQMNDRSLFTLLFSLYALCNVLVALATSLQNSFHVDIIAFM